MTGIAFDSDEAPFFVNLLFYYKNKLNKKLERGNIRQARRFGNMFILNDDINEIVENLK